MALSLTLIAFPAQAKARIHPQLLPPDGVTLKDWNGIMHRCLGEAGTSIEHGLKAPSDAALARMGGRSSRDFLDFSFMREIAGHPDFGAMPVVNSEENLPTGSGKEWSKASFKRDMSDRYVLCLLAMGFRWADGSPQPTESSPAAETAAPVKPASETPVDPLVTEGIEACRAGDKETALSRFVAAAEKGDVEAQFLAGMNIRMRPPEKGGGNSPSALAWLRKAADAGHAGAAYEMALYYDPDPAGGVTRDAVEGARWAMISARGGYAAGQNQLGWLYRYGVGVPMDYKLAETWYRAASEQGCAFGTENLGQLYERGLGVSEDPAEACRLYGLAAERKVGSSRRTGSPTVFGTDRASLTSRSARWHGTASPRAGIPPKVLVASASRINVSASKRSSPRTISNPRRLSPERSARVSPRCPNRICAHTRRPAPAAHRITRKLPRHLQANSSRTIRFTTAPSAWPFNLGMTIFMIVPSSFAEVAPLSAIAAATIPRISSSDIWAGKYCWMMASSASSSVARSSFPPFRKASMESRRCFA